MESDPIGLPGGVNTYGYAYASPAIYNDPTGLFLPAIGYGLAIACESGGCIALANAAINSFGVGLAIAILNDADDGAVEKASPVVKPKVKGKPCPPKPGNKDPCKGYRKELEIHKQKLAQYMKDPLSMDNKGPLKRALHNDRMDLFWQIRAGRIKDLSRQIPFFEGRVRTCEEENGI